MKSDDATRSAHKSETAASSQKARSAQESNQTNDTTRSAHKSETAASAQKAQSAQESNQTNATDKKELTPDEAAKFRAAFGTNDLDFVRGVIGQVGHLFPCNGTSDEDLLKFLVAIICGVKSRGPGEIMLAIQMAAVHTASIDVAKRLMAAESNAEIESLGNILTKLARTYATLMEVQQRCFPPP